MAPSRTVVASIFVLLSTHTLAFVVHKRSAYNPDVERGELKDALRLLERQRRRLDNIDGYDTEEPQEWWPREQTGDGIDDSDIDEAQYVPPADEYLQSILPPEEDGDSYPYIDNSHEYVTQADDKHSGEDYKETPVPADMQELEDMLEPTEDEEDIKSETKRETGMDLDMKTIDDQETEKKENKVEQLDPELVKKILAEADKMEVEKVKEYTKDESTSTVSPDELRDVLDEDENEPGNERKKKDDTEDAQGEVGAFLAPSDSGDVKKKRSGSNPLIEDTKISNNPNNIALNYIKQLILLEDRENTNLAQALNFATLAQLDSSGKYLPKEIEFLRNAIADEAELQDLLIGVGGEEQTTLDEDDDDMTEEPILQRKRADPEVGRPGLEDLSPSDREKAVILSYLLRKGAPHDGDLVPRETSDVESYNWLNGPVRDDRDFQDDDEKPLDRRIYRKRKGPDEAGTQRGVEGVLRSYLERMPSWERSQLKDAVEEQIQDLEADADEVCPAVVNLVQGCPLQGEEKVELDDEALDLCNRHSLCYSCGAMHGMSADDCDTGYMNEASRKCEIGDNECNDGITALYLMFLQHHRYIPASATEDMCADSCVIDFITGAEDK